MIWNSPPADRRPAQALADYLAGELDAASEGGPAGAAPRAYRREVAEAMAAFIEEHHARGGLPSEYVLLLTARALWSLGEEQAARRLMAVRGRELSLPAAFADAALAPDAAVAHWHILLAARVLRPSPLAGVPAGALWVLDLERIVAPSPAGLELAALALVRAVLDRAAGLWDGAEGRGLLGLRHARAMAAGILESPRHSAKSTALVAEIRDGCARQLQLIKHARGWRETPRVMVLDL
jgi:hypothetical protein